MNQSDQMAMADRMAAHYQHKADYVRTTTVLLGLLPLMYGVLTWVYGERLWAESGVYTTAMTVPWAPQSWGTVFMGLGAGTVWSAYRDRRRWTIALTLAMALVLSTFMITFLVVAVTGKVSALHPALVYGVVSLLFLVRARLAWVAPPTPVSGE